MYTNYDAIDAVYRFLTDKLADVGINIPIHRVVRPVDDLTEYIVINSLSVNTGVLQETRVNINVHVPNEQNRTKGKPDNSQPNFKRLKELTSVIRNLAHDKNEGDVFFYVEWDRLINEPETKNYFSNIRVETYLLNE